MSNQMAINNSKAALYGDARRATWLGLGINLTLGLAKLLGGLLGSSFALVSDAVNSLGDALTSAAMLFALRISQRPADERHPYGYSRAEAIAGSNIAVLIVVSALWVGWEALRRLGTEQQMPASWTLWIAGGNVLIKEALYQYKVRVGRRIGSMALIAMAWDHRSDAFCSFSVLAGLAVARLAGPRYLFADELAALVVVVAIVWSGVALFRKSAAELMDIQAERGLLQDVRRSARAVSGVHGVEKLWLRKSGLEYLADIHIEVHPELTVAEGHQIGHAVKARLLDEHPWLRDVLVHLEPHTG